MFASEDARANFCRCHAFMCAPGAFCRPTTNPAQRLNTNHSCGRRQFRNHSRQIPHASTAKLHPHTPPWDLDHPHLLTSEPCRAERTGGWPSLNSRPSNRRPQPLIRPSAHRRLPSLEMTREGLASGVATIHAVVPATRGREGLEARAGAGAGVQKGVSGPFPAP